MPRGSWSAKDERQYRHILKSCMTRRRGKKTCQRIAAATVNKGRARRRGLGGLASPALEHHTNARARLLAVEATSGFKLGDDGKVRQLYAVPCVSLLDAYGNAFAAVGEARAGRHPILAEKGTKYSLALREMLSQRCFK